MLSCLKHGAVASVSILILAACGGGSSGGGGSVGLLTDSGGDNQSQPIVAVETGPSDTNTPVDVAAGTTVAQLVGVWDFTNESPSGRDITYTVIRADGTGTDYDFQGDSADNGAQCYETENYRINSTGSGQFSVQFDNGATASVGVSLTSPNSISVTGDINGEFRRATLAESELVPLCNDPGVTVAQDQPSCDGNRIWGPFPVDGLSGYLSEAEGRSVPACLLFWQYSPTGNCSILQAFNNAADVNASIQNNGATLTVTVGGVTESLPAANVSIALLNSLPEC